MTRDEITQSALQTLRKFRYNCYADQDAFRASHTDDEEREAEEDAAAHTNQALNAILALIDQAEPVSVTGKALPDDVRELLDDLGQFLNAVPLHLHPEKHKKIRDRMDQFVEQIGPIVREQNQLAASIAEVSHD